MATILIVEDEKPIRDLIRINLHNAGYECTTAEDGMIAADLLEKSRYDLVILDIMLPKINGYELMEYVKTLKTPVIFLTAKASIADRVKGLHMGAEDYIVKPFAIAELLARVEVVLRRYGLGDNHLVYDEYQINLVERTIMKDDTMIELTPKEFDLFTLLVRNRKINMYRNQLFERVWEMEYTGDTRTLDLHIQRLRKKLGLEERLKTVYKLGYRLE